MYVDRTALYQHTKDVQTHTDFVTTKLMEQDNNFHYMLAIVFFSFL